MRKAVLLFFLGLAIGLSYPTVRRLPKGIALSVPTESKEQVEGRRIERNNNFSPCMNVFRRLPGVRMEVYDCRIKIRSLDGEGSSIMFDNNSCDVRETSAANDPRYKYVP